MLPRYRDGAGNRQRERTAHAYGAVENLINAAEICAAERGQAMRE
jgi:hypothetical protein